jgi:two-component system NtrC family sensor kinase
MSVAAMKSRDEKNMPTYQNGSISDRETAYKKLYFKFIFYTVICSLIPFLLVGWGINIHYTRFAKSRMINSLKTEIDHHRKIIQLFLDERKSELQLIAGEHTLEELIEGTRLQEIFDLLNKEKWSYTDLGVISENGRHLQYIGPHNLLDKNYKDTFWFKKVMSQGYYISDMFMGFRQEPHFVIAVAKAENGGKWIVRATINTEYFRSLVEKVMIGRTGEVYLVNQDGIFQTRPRFAGKIMEKSPFPIEPFHQATITEIRPKSVTEDGREIPKKISGRIWLEEPRWMLLVQQDYAEAFNDVNHANQTVLIFLIVAALTILIVAVFITRQMIRVIRKRDWEADQLNNQLLQTGKLAAIGELSAGVAHEINNPLAIVLTERQILLDTMTHSDLESAEFRDQIWDSLNQIDIQVQRCKRITQNLLRFAKRTESVIDMININDFIREVIELISREARANGIQFRSEFEENLPIIQSDPSQLQQVFLNLITNAIDAHENKPYGAIHITTASQDHDRIRITVADTGSGIPREILSNIFDPFFSTKPTGKGTGLGLSICYSIMRHLGGSISAQSEENKGTTFDLVLPLTPPLDLKEQLQQNNGIHGIEPETATG